MKGGRGRVRPGELSNGGEGAELDLRRELWVRVASGTATDQEQDELQRELRAALERSTTRRLADRRSPEGTVER